MTSTPLPRLRASVIRCGVLPLAAALHAAAQPAAPAARVAAEETIQLNPFEVQADSDKSYGALNSNSITQFNVELDKLPISADIFTQSFMGDTGLTSTFDVINGYSAGIGQGSATATASTTAVTNSPQDKPNGIMLRGLSGTVLKINGFLTNGASGSPSGNTFDVERVEVINGPQALLYGNGGGGGVVNTVYNQARFGSPSAGRVLYQVGQYGDKQGMIDYGVGSDTFALRLDLYDQAWQSHRLNIGGPQRGIYGQLAFKVLGNTVVRLSAEGIDMQWNKATDVTFTGVSTANDARNGQHLRYLLATNQIAASATGPSGSGAILNGQLNWDNVDSLEGIWDSYYYNSQYYELNAETQWNSWLSSQLKVGWARFTADILNPGVTLYAPTNATNPTGTWAMGITGTPMTDNTEPSYSKGIRYTLYAHNDLFQGAAQSSTILGVDSFRQDAHQFLYTYFQADSNWAVITTPGVTANNGRTMIPKLYWSVNNGLVQYPYMKPNATRIVYNGVNYIRMIDNPVNPAAISPGNPLGVTLNGATYQIGSTNQHGIYGVNLTSWDGGRLNTLLGFRYGTAYGETANTAGPAKIVDSKNLSVNAGLDYQVTQWLHPYVSVSSSYNPPSTSAVQNDPYGNPSLIAHAFGEEAGVKVATPDGKLSGSLALYHTGSKDEQYAITSTLLRDINPSGLNGQFASPSTILSLERNTTGGQITLTAAPTSGWNLRLSAAVVKGTLASDKSYGQLYNDQFHENSAGAVTYADGSQVYVSPTYNSKTPTVSATTAGAIPLTVALLNNPSSPYYANPLPVSGQINPASAVATVLKTSDPVHGSILTGAVGLPISSIQINPGFTPPGTIVAAKSGDITNGFPRYSVNFTSVYTWQTGWAKGFKAGGSASAAWDNLLYYYYPNGVSPTAPRIPLYWPTIAIFNAVIGYGHRIGRFEWSTQLNVNNLLNHYKVVLLPDANLGFSGINDATWSAQPRQVLWTNTISF